MKAEWQILFNPLVPLWGMAFLALGFFLVLGILFLRQKNRSSIQGLWLRSAFASLIIVCLANPSILAEKREPLKDNVLVVVDETGSIQLGERAAQIRTALDGLKKKLSVFENVSVELAHVNGHDKTELFSVVAARRASLPDNRLAGIIVLTDGQIHDVPQKARLNAPMHFLLAGNRDEFDRRLKIIAAPSYGLVGKPVTITARVEDAPKVQSAEAQIMLQTDDGSSQTISVPVGQDFKFDIPSLHAGKNFLALTTPVLPDELTAINNQDSMSLNGIRNRLKVLLVSGAPHSGERVWRNFLKADADVDLVHFTILRSPDKFVDGVRPGEMALIAFPVHELFATKLQGFDLIIFDRFAKSGLIPDMYLQNVVEYVKNGGALLVSANTEDMVLDRLSASPLGDILPLQPTGGLLRGAFRPSLSAVGLRHPVTAPLAQALDTAGEWFRQAAATPKVGADIVLTGLGAQPILALSHVGQGRVAQFASDEFWLWSRNYNGGGPEAELLRRTAHWLMKEPELEETALQAMAAPVPVEGQKIATPEPDLAVTNQAKNKPAEPMNGSMAWQITATLRSLKEASKPFELIGPEGEKYKGSLTEGPIPGVLSAQLTVLQTGLYKLTAGNQTALVLAGQQGTPEYADMRATAEHITSAATDTGGGIFWLSDLPQGPEIRLLGTPAFSYSGNQWLGLKKNGMTRVVGSTEYPLLPAGVLLGALLIIILWCWWRESRTR